MATETFKQGDFVRVKSSASVGVVWQIHPESTASVEVYWRTGQTERTSISYEPGDLVLVPPDQVPDYAVALKQSLEPFPKPRRR